MQNKKLPYGKISQYGIDLKKQYGQHFLRDQSVVDYMLSHVNLDRNSSVFEIGCGDGFLTRSILKKSFQRLWVFEIDSSWANFVQKTYPDKRMTIFEEDILTVDFSIFEPFKPWILLSNLPYQITFAIIFKLIEFRHLISEAVIMVQEEVAQKILKTGGKDYGFNSLYLQYYFDWQLLKKIPPSAFVPPPKVYSRLLYFKPKKDLVYIENSEEFWKFIKRSFAQPRRNLKNNLRSFHYDLSRISEEQLQLRAQQLNFDNFLKIWNQIIPIY